MQFVAQQAATSGNALFGLVGDVDSLLAVGHSRGAKMAALHLAGAAPQPSPSVLSAVLLDPVDNTQVGG